MDSGHTSRLTSRIKGKQRIKECFYMEPTCSNIAVQRTASDHMSYTTRVRAKFEMDGEIAGLGLPGHRDFTNSYTNRAITTCRLPLNCGAPSYSKVPVPLSTTLVYKETTHIPLGLQPYGLTSKNMGKPEGTMNRHLNRSYTSTHTSHMNVGA
jgi:hypothetical protein